LPAGAQVLDIDYDDARSNRVALRLARTGGSRKLVEVSAADSGSVDLIIEIAELERAFDPRVKELFEQFMIDNPGEGPEEDGIDEAGGVIWATADVAAPRF
jgi:hypothetical protein